MADFYQWLSKNPVVMGIILIGFIVVIVMYVVAVIQGREVTFWPPGIGSKPIVAAEDKAISQRSDTAPTPETTRIIEVPFSCHF